MSARHPVVPIEEGIPSLCRKRDQELRFDGPQEPVRVLDLVEDPVAPVQVLKVLRFPGAKSAGETRAEDELTGPQLGPLCRLVRRLAPVGAVAFPRAPEMDGHFPITVCSTPEHSVPLGVILQLERDAEGESDDGDDCHQGPYAQAGPQSHRTLSRRPAPPSEQVAGAQHDHRLTVD